MRGRNNGKNDVTLLCNSGKIVGGSNSLVHLIPTIFFFGENMFYNFRIAGIKQHFTLTGQEVRDYAPKVSSTDYTNRFILVRQTSRGHNLPAYYDSNKGC